MEEIGIDAARHPATGAICVLLQLPAEFRIGCKQAATLTPLSFKLAKREAQFVGLAPGHA
jgi:hypothetical protein